MPLSCSVSKAVETNLHRKALCISNSWDTELTSSLIDLQGDACCADTLECMSPLPPSALCSHILNNHRWLWRLFCLYATTCICVNTCDRGRVWMHNVSSFTTSPTHTHTHTRSALLTGCSVVANKGIRHASSSQWQRSPTGRLTIVPQIWTYHLITLGEGLDSLVKMQVS